MEATKVAVLGTGRMGGALARRLQASGFAVTVWDRTREKAEHLKVGPVAATPADAIRGANVVLSSLTDAAAVRSVYLGRDGIIEHAAGQLLVEMSTGGPDVIEEIAQQARVRGVRLLEAPVLGSVPAVESGTLAILVGGLQAELEQARPVLERLGEVHSVGALGSAARLKLVANSMLGIISAAAAELLAAGTAAGLERGQVFWALARYAPLLKAREAGFLRDQHQPTMFAVRDLVKDLDLALNLYDRAQASVPLTLTTRALFADGLPGSSDLDISAIVRRPARVQQPHEVQP